MYAELAMPDVDGRPFRPVTARDHAAVRAAQPDFWPWLDHVTPAGECTQPIRLAGEVHTVEADTGRILATRTTADMPDGVLYKACGNRRESVCPHCSKVYQRDAYQLIKRWAGRRQRCARQHRHPPVPVRHSHRTRVRCRAHPGRHQTHV